jgi:hypothetical protein
MFRRTWDEIEYRLDVCRDAHQDVRKLWEFLQKNKTLLFMLHELLDVESSELFLDHPVLLEET